MAKITFRKKMIILIVLLAAAVAAVIGALAAPYLRRVPAAGVFSPPPEDKRLVIYTSHKQEVWWPLVKEFEERTGICVEVVEGGTNELLETLRSSGENNTGCDVMFGGGEESLYYYRDLFRPYRSADAGKIHRQYLSSGDLWTSFSALPVVLIYNPKLVPEGELTSWQDLLDPRYEGRIAFADPAVSASSFTGLATLICACGGEEKQSEILEKFARNLGGLLMPSSGDVLSEVASGTCLVGISLEETALKRIRAGENLAIVYPDDGTSVVPDGSAILKNAPHPENAELFLDYTVSEDVQNLLVSRFCRRSVRKDIPEDASLPGLRDIAVLDYDIMDIDSRRSAIMTGFAFFFGEEAVE